jgi:hypothetical protein
VGELMLVCLPAGAGVDGDERVANRDLGFSRGGTQTGPLRDARRFTSTRSEGYAYDVGDW